MDYCNRDSLRKSSSAFNYLIDTKFNFLKSGPKLKCKFVLVYVTLFGYDG